MVRWLAVVALALAFTPRDAIAAPGGRPLRTWCFSPTMDYCISLLSFEYSYFQQREEDTDGDVKVYADLRASGTGFGLGHTFELDALTVMFEVDDPGGYNWPMLTGNFDPRFTHPGDVKRYGEGDDIRTPLRELTIDDFAVIDWFVLDQNDDRVFADRCFTSEKWHAFFGGDERDGLCYTVPEPASLLLLLPGMLGIAYVSRRRVRRTP